MQKTILILVMALLCLILSSNAQSPDNNKPAQNQTITGKVTSVATGEALPGAVIKNTTTNQTVITNNDGDFTLQLPNGNYNLAIYYLSYKAKNITIQIPLKEKLIISLETDEQNLKEVEINAGYYTVKDKERTGNISRVTAETISKQPVSNPLQSLQGRMAGVQIQQTSGFAGGNFKVNIRGQNSLRPDGNYPLYIIDGIPFISASIATGIGSNITAVDPLSNFNPDDIESIEVLKDADATAIYGSRGANGVVLITTKKGKAGETKLDVNIYQGVAEVPHFMNLLHTDEYLKMRTEAFKNDNKPIGTTDYDLNGTWDSNRYTDWQKVLIGGTAHTNDVQLGISGGNEQTRFLLKAGKHRETTVLPVDGDADHKYTALLNLNHIALNQKFKANISVSYLKDNNDIVQTDPTYQALTLAPNAPEYFDNAGNINWQNGTWQNPFAAFTAKYFNQNQSLIANTTLSYELLTGLNAKTNLGYTEISLNERNTLPSTYFNPNATSKIPSAYFSDSKTYSWIVEPQLEYKKAIKKGTLTVLLGATFQKNRSAKEILNATGFSNDEMLAVIKAATSISVTSQSQGLYKYTAVFGRINYDWEGKYLLNLTGRRDGSSRFGPGKQFANFGAAGAAWIFSQENFIKNSLPFLSFGKLRASYGVTGSDQIGDYGYYDLWNPTTYNYGSDKGLYPFNLFNAAFGWEQNQKFETAAELGFLADKISFSFAYYRNRSGNQLVGFPVPATTGFNSIQSNLPAIVQNTGYEMELNTHIFHSKHFKWNASFNISIPKNKLIAFPGIENTNYKTTREVGKSTYIVRSYRYTGIDATKGIYTFEDKNTDGLLNAAGDYQSLAERSQKYYGGFQNVINYKNWALTVFIQFAKQTGDSYLNYNFVAPGFIGNQPAAVPGPIQRFTQTTSAAYSAYYNLINSDQKITDASYMRLKNLSLAYNLPGSLISKLKMQKASIYFQGQNLWTLTNYTGLDPETQNTNLPPLRTLTMGIQITF